MTLMQNAIKMQQMSNVKTEEYYQKYSLAFLKCEIVEIKSTIEHASIDTENYVAVLNNRIRIIEKVIEEKMK